MFPNSYFKKPLIIVTVQLNSLKLMLCLNEGSLRLKGCFSFPTKEVLAG